MSKSGSQPSKNKNNPPRNAAHQSHKKQVKKGFTSTSMWLWIILIVIIVLGVVSWIFISNQRASEEISSNNATSSEKLSSTLPPEITVPEAFEKYQSGSYFLDVRQPEEWAEYHAPNSTLIPLGELPNRLNELPRDQEIVVVCRSGNRSQQGRDVLLNAGFSQVTSMAGGLKEWKSAGYPTVSGP